VFEGCHDGRALSWKGLKTRCKSQV
jgi:hypothetical protein